MHYSYGFARLCFAAGLRSVGDRDLNEAADKLIETVDLDIVKENEFAFANHSMKTKLISFIPMLSDVLEEENHKIFWDFYRARKRLSELCQPIMDSAYEILLQEGISVIAHKGTDMLYYYGNVLNQRFMSDSDPLVRPEDLDRVDAALKANGFIVGHVDRTRLSRDGKTLWYESVPSNDIEWVRENHHEAHPYFKFVEVYDLGLDLDFIRKMTCFHVVQDRVFALPNIDVHWSIGSGVHATDLWEPPLRQLTLPSGFVVQAISAELNLCFQCGRAYNIAMALGDDTCNYMVDAFRICLHPDGLDWERVLTFCKRYKMEAGLYHVLEWLELLKPRTVPTEVLSTLRDYLISHREYDLGDHLMRTLGEFPAKRFQLGSAPLKM